MPSRIKRPSRRSKRARADIKPGSGGDIFARVKSNAVERLSWTASRRTNLHMETRVLKRGERVLAYKQPIKIEMETIMVFADDAPRYNWAHPCRYLLHDAKTGNLYREVPAQFPPYLAAVPSTYLPFHEPVRIPKDEFLWPIWPPFRCPFRWTRGRRYAILFSGASNNRHTNDLEFLYRALRNLYNFSAADITVLNYNGTINYSGGPPVGNWPGNNTPYQMPVNGQGTKAALEGALNSVKAKLKSDDLLLIHTNNHGGHNGTESYLCTSSGPDYLASDFANKLGTLPAYNCLMVMMEQCHSGGFNAPIISKSTAALTSVSSACLELNSSIGGAQFDPFARDWIAAMSGHMPNGGPLASNPDTDGTGKVSAREAHNYADSVHDPFDTPIYHESSVAAGNCHLGQRFWYIWPIYCRLLVEALRPHYIRMPIPEFYRLVHEKLVPSLKDVESKLETTSQLQERELAKALSALVTKVF
jgi:hypothetical protein